VHVPLGRTDREYSIVTNKIKCDKLHIKQAYFFSIYNIKKYQLASVFIKMALFIKV